MAEPNSSGSGCVSFGVFLREVRDEPLRSIWAEALAGREHTRDSLC